MTNKSEIREIYLAGGCFWGLEAWMKKVPGVVAGDVGYANGRTQNPGYHDLAHSGHAETVRVEYDRKQVSLDTLLTYFFRAIDPTSVNGQGPDHGRQYRSGIYYTDPTDLPIIQAFLERAQSRFAKPLAVEVTELVHYFPAEDYHQEYLRKNPAGYCHLNLEDFDRPVVPLETYADKKIEDAGLTPLQLNVLRKNATEPPFDNAYWDKKEDGLYVDAGTGEPLFSSRDKFDSGSGWPSFTRPLVPEVVTYHVDRALGMVRTEVRSRAGDNHLGHVFDDGPLGKGGKRYCINSAALRFIPVEQLAQEGYQELTACFSTAK